MPNIFCDGMGQGMMYGGHWTGIWFQATIVLLFFLIVWWMLRETRQSQYSIERGESAEDVLKKRYAKGELTKKQFEDMKKEIGV